jgi:hypothetical protein
VFLENPNKERKNKMEDKNIRQKLDRIENLGSRLAIKTEKECTKMVTGAIAVGESIGDFLRGYAYEQGYTSIGPLATEFSMRALDNVNYGNSESVCFDSSLGVTGGVFTGALEDIIILSATAVNIASVIAPETFQVPPFLSGYVSTATGLAIAKGIGLTVGFAYKFGRKSEQNLQGEKK